MSKELKESKKHKMSWRPRYGLNKTQKLLSKTSRRMKSGSTYATKKCKE